MKKFLLAIIVAASLQLAVPVGAQEKPVDLIVLLDASQSMFPYFTEVVDFVVSRIAREYLRFGDTFHLLTFTDTAQIEIAQSVRTEQDLKRLLGRLYLLYPLGKSTDLVSALSALYRYTADLPESNRKLIIMVTDGMHNPSPQSPNAGLSADEVRAAIEGTTVKIRENGWTIRIVRVPFIGAGEAASGKSPSGAPGAAAGGAGAPAETLGASPGAGDYLGDVAAGLGAPVTDFTSESREDAAGRSVEIPRISFPGHLGKVGYDFAFPLGITNPSSRNLKLELSGVQARGRNLLRKDVFIEIPAGDERTVQIPLALPDGTVPGETTLEIELRFEDGIRVVPTTGMLSFELVRRPFARLFRATGQAVLFLVLLLLALSLIAVLVLYVRGLHRRSEEPLVAAVLDSEAVAAEERRQALAAARQEGPARVTTEEARAYAADLVPKHVTEDEAQRLHADLLPKHVTDEEAQALEADLLPKHVTEDEAKLFAESRSITEEEAAKYRDETARSAAEALASFAAATSTRRGMNAAAGQPMQYEPLIKRTGSLRVEFRVEDQNPHIGLRNIRTLHSGGKKSIGGKRSDFLVFLVPVPARVAEVYYDGEDLTLVPLKPEFFPDYSGPVSGCLSRKVQMVSRHGKVLTISFSRYVPPVDGLNRLLHCVDAPGLLETGDTKNESASGLA